MTTNTFAMQPRIRKRERKLQLSYDLPHRIHNAHIYPIAAPNGSTIIIYGHATGVRVLWRGGRRRRQRPQHPATTNGTKTSTDIIVLDDDDDEQQQSTQGADYEDEEEEQDPDCPYPNIIQDLNLETGGDVLHVAIPALPPSASIPGILQKVAVIVIASADGSLRTLQIPLAPPEDARKDEFIEQIVRSQIELVASGPLPRAIAIKLLRTEDQATTARTRQQDSAYQFLVACANRSLSIWTAPVVEHAIVADRSKRIHKLALHSPAAHLSFHPSSKSSALLLTDVSGAVRIFDPYATRMPQRPASSGSSHSNAPMTTELGNWVITFQAPFENIKESDVSPALVRRKKVLDAEWVLTGKGILTLLDDGQWGVWDVTGSTRPGKNLQEFVLEGYLASATSSEPAEPTLPKKGLSKLAPMTPNTRKSKAEQLFTAPTKVQGTAARGGISVAANHSRSGQADETVAMWYNSEVYSITSMQSFWQRSTSNGGGIGSLYAPGLSHISDLDLFNENITSLSQFSSRSSSAGIGQMNTQRDLLVSAESRAIVLQALRPSTTTRTLFEVAERPAAAHRDQQMLDAGALGTDGLDRMLDNMQSGNTATRRVGFAS